MASRLWDMPLTTLSFFDLIGVIFSFTSSSSSSKALLAFVGEVVAEKLDSVVSSKFDSKLFSAMELKFELLSSNYIIL